MGRSLDLSGGPNTWEKVITIYNTVISTEAGEKVVEPEIFFPPRGFENFLWSFWSVLSEGNVDYRGVIRS